MTIVRRVWHGILEQSTHEHYAGKIYLSVCLSNQNVWEHFVIYSFPRSSVVVAVHLHLHDLAIGKAPFCRVAVFCARGLVHHTSFRKHHAKPATFAKDKVSPDHNTKNSVPSSLRIVCGSHSSCLRTRVVRWDLRLIVLNRADLKV